MQLSGAQWRAPSNKVAPSRERHAITWRPVESAMQESGAHWRAPCNKVAPIGERHAIKWRPLESAML